MIKKFIKDNKFKLLLLLVVVLAVAIDFIVKKVIENNLNYNEEIKVINNFFYITLHYNDAAGFGLFSFEEPFRTIFFLIVTIIALSAFGYIYFKYCDIKKYKILTICILLIISGTIGNFIDRMFNENGVVDFLLFYLLGLNNEYVRYINPFPTFNIADSYLTIGVFLLIFDFIFGKTGKLFDDKKEVVKEELDTNSDIN